MTEFLEKLYESIENVANRIWKYPPGPYGLPFVGYAPYLTDRPYIQCFELSKKYGDIFSINIGRKRWIILNSVDSVREAMLKHDFLGRPDYGLFNVLKKDSPFFTYRPVHEWDEQRKFVMNSLGKLGMGSSKLEEKVKVEINYLLQALKSQEGKPTDITELLTLSMQNNISFLLFGARQEYDDPEAIELNRCLAAASKYVSQTALVQLFPWVRFIPFLKGSAFKGCLDAYQRINDIFREKVEDHKKTIDPGHIRDFIDSYLIEKDYRRQKNIKTSLHDNLIADTVSDLYLAGSETVYASISWGIYAVAAYPEIQERIKEEISDVIGFDRMARISDKKLMPFTQATCNEVLRFITIIPFNGLHHTEVDTTLGDYFIPKNTEVIANLWAVHHDPRYWEDPHRFKPERFLSEDGKSVITPPYFLPFSIGKRNCPGEVMANNELFLYLVTILQTFDIEFPEGFKPTFNSRYATSLKPREYEVRFLSRN